MDPRDLAPEVRSQLRTLSKLAADRVARHLVAAGRLIDEDPEAALMHARAARALGARVAVVRQAVGETAYAAGEWAEAIAELRTARRMSGDDSALPLLADAERALGRADRALRLAQSPEAQSLPPAERAEMRIVEAGARRDLGQVDAALVTLQGAGLDRRTVEPWSARLWYAYADLLLALGRADEARGWFAAAAAVDGDGTTDADERVLELDGVEVLTDEEGEDLADEEDLPTEDAPTDEAPTNEAPTNGRPTHEAPTDGRPTHEAPTNEAPTNEALTNDSPADDMLPNDASADDMPPNDSPADDMPPSDAPAEDAPTDGGRGGGEFAGVGQRVAGDASPEDVGDGTDPVDLPSGDSPATVLTFSADDETDQELADEEAREAGEAGEAGGRSVAAVAFSDSDSGAEDQDQSGSSA